ncbi:hypothetical protein B0O80DRAFT_482175 [Mortierella sp. GBAus27b]|nr:hypothetical protein B0O80DRAFT_482175 [Mortierella sp. GBAus27b]
MGSLATRDTLAIGYGLLIMTLSVVGPPVLVLVLTATSYCSQSLYNRLSQISSRTSRQSGRISFLTPDRSNVVHPFTPPSYPNLKETKIVTMFRNSTPPTQGGLSPERTLELANVCLENARKAKDPELALELCDLAGEALSRLKHNARAIASFTDTQDHASRERISTTYLEIGKLQDDLQQHEKAQASYKRAEKWGQTHHGGLIQRPGSPFRSSRHGSRLRLAQSKSNSGSMVALGSLPTPPPTHHGSDCDVATVPSHIFTENTSPPAIVSSLPESGAHLNDTPQLACCLGLLQASPSPDDILEQATRDWIQETEQDTDEQERLKTLAIDVIREFLRDELKDDKAVAEVVCLAPVLEKDAYRDLLRQFYMGIDQSSLLDLHQLEGLARMIQGASPGYLDADDLVKTLELLGTRLKDTHQQSTYYIYQLTLAISHVLDAMADSKVRGLDREKLHEPLSSYLDRLKGSDDPYLVYQSAYAFQALLYVPDNETPWQATLRRTGKVIQGLSGLVSAVKGFDLNAFVEGLSDIQQGLAGASQVVDAVKTAYSGVASLAESGKDFLDCLKEGLSFDRKRTWYQALRGADTLIQEGQFAKLRRLICEVPCRNDPAFQWGLCQRLGDIAANHMWNMEVRQSAVGFLGEIYRNDDVWGHHANIKQCVLNILMQLTSPSGTGLHCM